VVRFQTLTTRQIAVPVVFWRVRIAPLTLPIQGFSSDLSDGMRVGQTQASFMGKNDMRVRSPYR